jgi:endonuclease/exonuclease/phosphatase family metal-dependent hydrolase
MTMESRTASPSPWHALAAQVVLQQLATGTEGLSAAEAARRLEESGPNRLPPAQRRGPLFRFLSQFLIVQNILSYDNTRRNEEIRNLLRRIEKEEYPYIIAGDFNMSDQTVIYGEISAEMTDSFREAGTGSGNSWPVLVLDHITTLIPPLLRVDYIWHSQEFRTVEAFRGPELGSDHLPLVAELELLE